jgi:hypothetical protein
MQTVTVYRSDDPYESWIVEMIDPDNDGTCEKAVFYGAKSERPARDWAAQEYSSEPVRRHA